MARVSALPISVHLVLSEASEVVEHHPSVETLAQWTRISCFALRLIQPGQQQINILLLQNLFLRHSEGRRLPCWNNLCILSLLL